MSQPASKSNLQRFALGVDEAQQRIWQDCKSIEGRQQIDITQALHRVLAEPMYSPIDVPPLANSAVDGYAFRHEDLHAESATRLFTVGVAYAGKPYQGPVEPGQAVRIMTGAVLPAGTNCVVMQERVKTSENWIEIADTLREGENIRQAGEDLARGKIALRQGKRLQPADLGLLASLGIRELTVRRRLRVAFFSSGDELRSLGQPLAPGQIYDSNRYILQGLLQHLGFDLIDLGVVEDDPLRIGQALEGASQEADAVITSGGVSVGDADYLREVMTRLGQMHFWQIAMKPGRPLAFGRIGDVPLFGLPGNPVAVMVTFYQFVQPALLKMSGVAGVEAPRRFRVRSASRFRKIAGRCEFQRAVLESDSAGELVVRSTGRQGSGVLRSMSEANCLVVLSSSSETVNQGDWVEVQPFEGLLQ